MEESTELPPPKRGTGQLSEEEHCHSGITPA